MFNHIHVEFPGTSLGPKYTYSATIKQSRFEHEIAIINFRDWGVEYDVVKPKTPVKVIITGTKTKRNFYGYVHHVRTDQTPGKNFTELVVIGASYLMGNPSQTIYKETTADRVIKTIATKHSFVCDPSPHPRVYPQISQTGHTDWEFMVRLAKQSGYTLRAENTELYFQPILQDFTNLRQNAPKFIMRGVTDPEGSTIYSFKPLIGESLDFKDAKKAAIAISGLDKTSNSRIAITKQIKNKKTRRKQQSEFFNQFDTSVVANDIETAGYEAEAADNKNTFPYRARVEVLGDPDLRPDLPVFLDGLGTTYSGYWVVLEAEHRIIEEQLNQQLYTTVITVGIDSLGTADSWADNKVVTSPDYLQKRTIIPNVKQTKVVPKTGLSAPSTFPTPQTKGTFGGSSNRKQIPAAKRTQTEPVWKSTTRTLNNIIPKTTKSPIITKRVLKKGS
ncbi:MAG: contractile injection system protein, VgrG/Pvc8 family [Paludibacter sp.]